MVEEEFDFEGTLGRRDEITAERKHTVQTNMDRRSTARGSMAFRKIGTVTKAAQKYEEQTRSTVSQLALRNYERTKALEMQIREMSMRFTNRANEQERTPRTGSILQNPFDKNFIDQLRQKMKHQREQSIISSMPSVAVPVPAPPRPEKGQTLDLAAELGY